MKRPVKHMRSSLKPVPSAEQPSEADQPATGPQATQAPLVTYVQGVPGPDGRWWVSVQVQQYGLALAFALPPEDVEHWFSVTGRDARAMAAKLRQENAGLGVHQPPPGARPSGLIVVGPQGVPRRTT